MDSRLSYQRVENVAARGCTGVLYTRTPLAQFILWYATFELLDLCQLQSIVSHLVGISPSVYLLQKRCAFHCVKSQYVGCMPTILIAPISIKISLNIGHFFSLLLCLFVEVWHFISIPTFGRSDRVYVNSLLTFYLSPSFTLTFAAFFFILFCFCFVY